MPSSRSSSAGAVTAGQAQYVLRRLVEDRRISERDIARYAGEMASEIRTLEERLRRLRDALGAASRGQPDSATRAPTARARTRKPARKRHLKLSPERLAALKVQGHYLALIRRLPKTRRAQYKKMFKDKGPDAALKALRQALGK